MDGHVAVCVLCHIPRLEGCDLMPPKPRSLAERNQVSVFLLAEMPAALILPVLGDVLSLAGGQIGAQLRRCGLIQLP